MQLAQLFASDRRSTAAGANARAEQRFISVNVSHAAEKCLIEQSTLDGSLAAAKEGHEAVEIDFQGLDAAGGKICRRRDAEAAEAAGIDEAQFPAGGQSQDGVGVLLDFCFRLADLHAARHAKVNDPLGGCGSE